MNNNKSAVTNNMMTLMIFDKNSSSKMKENTLF